jgi:hypothetical protein
MSTHSAVSLASKYILESLKYSLGVYLNEAKLVKNTLKIARSEVLTAVLR